MKEAAIATHQTPTSDQPWDGPAVIAAIPGDASETDLKKIFAWVDDASDPGVKASYKFPHHEADGQANLAAAVAGIAVLNGGRGGANIPDADRKGVWNHLAAHLKDGGMEVAPLEADAGGPDVQAALDAVSGHLDGLQSSYEDLVAAIGGAPAKKPAPPAAKPADGTPPGKDGGMMPPQSASFDPKAKGSLEELAKAMIGDASFAASVHRVASSLMGDELEGDFVALAERAVADDGIVNLRVITPGWGSSGYYSPEVLERDGPKVFTAGTKMFWNHQTDAEEESRPEGDLRDLAGELVEDVSWNPNGPEGAGLYAKAKVFAGFRDAVDELAPHIGVSIRAMGKASHGSVEGREGPVIDALTHGRSVDYVTAPGAGGKVMSLFESAGRKGELNMEDAKKLAEAQEKLAARDAGDVIREALKDQKLPDAAVKRLTEALPAKAKLNDEGELDRDSFADAVKTAIADEVAYLTEVTGAGSIRNLGGGTPEEAKAVTESLESSFQDMGLSEDAAKVAAAGRN